MQKVTLDISVAMTTYNGALYLKEQLDSLATQTVLPCELVVCDDGSGDATLDILNRFAQEAPFPVRVYRNPERLGYSDNFLQTIPRCQGDLIAFCDQDDVWFPEKLARCQEYFLSDSRTMLVCHNAWITDQDLKKVQPLLRRTKATRYKHLVFRVSDEQYLGFTQVIRRTLVPYLAVSPRATFSLYPEPMPHDQWSVFLAAGLGGIVVDGNPMAYHRQHASNTVGVQWIKKPLDAPHEARPSPATSYRNNESLLQNWGEVYAALAETSAQQSHRQMFQGAADRCRYSGQLYRLRCELYEEQSSVAGKLRRLLAVARDGGYTPRKRGGLGVKSFAKDVVFFGRSLL